MEKSTVTDGERDKVGKVDTYGVRLKKKLEMRVKVTDGHKHCLPLSRCFRGQRSVCLSVHGGSIV